MVPNRLYHLKTKCGKFLDVMKFKDAMKLQVVDVQNKEFNGTTVF